MQTQHANAGRANITPDYQPKEALKQGKSLSEKIAAIAAIWIDPGLGQPNNVGGIISIRGQAAARLILRKTATQQDQGAEHV